MLARRLYLLTTGLAIILFSVTSCVSNATPNDDAPILPAIQTNPVATTPQVRIEWAYRDDQRLGVEVSITNYPLPQGFQTICPLTQVELRKNEGEGLALYRNPEQISLDEFYTIAQHSRWFCVKQREDNGLADYLFSVISYNANASGIKQDMDAWLHLEMGEVIATNAVSAVTLPNQGRFDIPLDFGESDKRLTWFPAFSLTNHNVLVEIERVSLNPSFALLDACIEYQDHHFWKPIAAIFYQDKAAYSTEFLPTFPAYPSERDLILKSTRRCYSFSIPLDFQVDQSAPFQVGIDRVQIVNNDPAIVTMQECEAVKKQVEAMYSGLKVRCRQFESHNQQQHWFEVVSHPPSMSAQGSYELVEANFTQEIVGAWYLEIDRNNQIHR